MQHTATPRRVQLTAQEVHRWNDGDPTLIREVRSRFKAHRVCATEEPGCILVFAGKKLAYILK